MENDTTAHGPADPALDLPAAAGERSAADLAGLVLLALVVVLAGLVVGVLGPLAAVACDSCQDGVRSQLRFADTLLGVARFGVPVTVVLTVVAMFTARRGARAGGVGLGVLGLLLVLMMALGEITG
ncbi:hypothetical protein [Streptomyces sp. NPDC054784]